MIDTWLVVLLGKLRPDARQNADLLATYYNSAINIALAR